MRDPNTMRAKRWFIQAMRRRHPIKSQNAAVPVAFGTDPTVYPHKLNGREFAVLVKLGMTPLQAIRSATLDCSQLLGWDDRLGTIEPGKFADMIAVESGPLQDVTRTLSQFV
jgi:imidazolonepropionase-like amidohydrolase